MLVNMNLQLANMLYQKKLVRKSYYSTFIQRFEYSSLGIELKKQTDIAKKTISNIRQVV